MKNDYDAPEGETFDEIYQSDSLRWMSIVVVLLVVFGFFGLAWYAYRTNTRPADDNAETLVIEADNTPYKETPKDPGGTHFPHQDKDVYNRLVAEEEKAGSGKVERLLPPAEELQAERKTSEEAEDGTGSWINKKIHPDDMPVGEIEDDANARVEVIEAAPKKVAERAAEVKQQKDIPAYVPPKPVVKPWVPVEEKTAPKAAVVKAPKEDPIVAQAEKFVQEKQAKKPVVKTSPPTPAPVVSPVVSTPPVAGGVEVQLAALRSKAEAETVWQKLSTRHKDVLAGKSHRVMAVDIPGKGTFYRLRVSAGTAATAKALCTTLTQRKQACLLAK